MRVLDYTARSFFDGTIPHVALGMTGQAPTTDIELKAAVDIYDALDMYNKCVCIDSLTSAGVTVPTPPNPLNNSFMNQRYLRDAVLVPMVKKGQIGCEQARLSVTAGDRVPDRLWVENADGTRRNPKGHQTVALFHEFCMQVEGWQHPNIFRVPPRTAVDGSTLYLVQDFDSPFNLTSVRIGPYAWQGISAVTIALDAWVNGAWQQVMAPQVQGNSGKVVAVTPVVASRFRVRRIYGGALNSYEGGGLTLQSTDPRPEVALQSITWCIVIPMGAGPQDILATSVSAATGPTIPVACEVFTAGGPSDSGKEVAFSKATALVSTDMPTFVGVTLSRRGMGE